MGSNTLHWITDGCSINVLVWASMPSQWAYGVEQPAPFDRFKDWALQRYEGDEHYPIGLDVVPDWGVDKGNFGCADLGMGHDLKPGAKLIARLFVRVSLGDENWYGTPPSGPVLLTGSFNTWYRGAEDLDAVNHDSLVVKLVVKLKDGRDPGLLSAGQALDVALGNGQLRSQITAYPSVPDFVPTSVVLDEDRGQWVIGAGFERAAGAEPITIRVDARTARIVQVLEKPAPTRDP